MLSQRTLAGEHGSKKVTGCKYTFASELKALNA